MAKPLVAIIILNWNGHQDTLECLESIELSHKHAIAIQTYVVDNASSDNSVIKISKKFPHVRIISNKKNLGYSGGNNIGIKQALKDSSDYIILLNNDTTVHQKTFTNLVTHAVKNQFDIASPKIYFYPSREFHLQDYAKSERGTVIWYAGGRMDWPNVWGQHFGINEVDHGQLNQVSETDFATGCCMLISRKVINKIGLLDTDFTAYFEDNDYCQRARKKDFKIGYIPTSIMWHKNAGSTGGSGSITQKKLVDKSRLRFALKHAPLRAKLALIKYSITHR